MAATATTVVMVGVMNDMRMRDTPPSTTTTTTIGGDITRKVGVGVGTVLRTVLRIS